MSSEQDYKLLQDALAITLEDLHMAGLHRLSSAQYAKHLLTQQGYDLTGYQLRGDE